MGIFGGLQKAFSDDETEIYTDVVEEENRQLRKKLKKNNKSIINIMNERDDLKDELLKLYRLRSKDFDQVINYKEEYAKYYNLYKEQKKEIAELKSLNRQKDEIIKELEDKKTTKKQVKKTNGKKGRKPDENSKTKDV